MNNKKKDTELVPVVSVQSVKERGYLIERNGKKIQVVLDKDLAEYYGVEVRRLNQQVNRALTRGSILFNNEVFQLEPDEWENILRLKLQNAT